MKLGKLGVFHFLEMMRAKEVAAFAQRIESPGYSALWYPEAVGREALIGDVEVAALRTCVTRQGTECSVASYA